MYATIWISPGKPMHLDRSTYDDTLGLRKRVLMVYAMVAAFEVIV